MPRHDDNLAPIALIACGSALLAAGIALLVAQRRASEQRAIDEESAAEIDVPGDEIPEVDDVPDQLAADAGREPWSATPVVDHPAT